jgi:hypothetical protein
MTSFPENWTPPPELRALPPRVASMAAPAVFVAIMRWMLLLGAIPLLLLFRSQNVRTVKDTEALHRDGREVNGNIVRRWTTDKGDTNMVSYAFSANGAQFTGESSVPGRLWADVRNSRVLPLRYLPADPKVNHPLAWDEDPDPPWVAFILPAILVLVGVGLTILLTVFRKVTAEGLPAPGVVTKCVSVKGGWMVSYQFRTQEKEVRGGSSQFNRRLEVGTPVCVLYLPQNPRRNHVYPNGMYRVKQ